MNEKRFGRALRNVVRKFRDEREYATVGRLNADGSYTIQVPERPNFVYVVMATGTLTQAINRGRVPLRATLPVKLIRLHDGTLMIDREDDDLLEGDTHGADEYGVLPHPLGSHSNVTFTSETAGNVAKYDGTDWINSNSIPEAVAATIEAATEQTVLNTSDRIPLVDSGVLKWAEWFTFLNELTTTFNLLYDKTATIITALTTKTTPVGADAIVITDSAASDVPKRLTFTNLGTYLSTIYGALATINTWALTQTFTTGLTSPAIDGSTAANGDIAIQGTTNATRTSSYVALQPNGGNVAVGKSTAGAKLDVAGAARFAGTGTAPSADGTGQALEIWYWTGAGGPYGLLLAFDRDASTYKPLRIAGDSIGFEEGATRIMTIDGGNVGIGVNPGITPLHVKMGTNQNLGVVSSSSEVTITAFNDAGSANVPLRILGSRVRTIVASGGSMLISASGIVGSEVELMPAGSITKGMRILGDAYDSVSRESLSFQITKPGAGNTVVVTGGVFTTKLYSTGQLVVFRSSGAETYDLIAHIIYK